MNLAAMFLITSNLYIVQNIASLTLRVYNYDKLILQAPMVVGKSKKGIAGENYKSHLGAYTIESWNKFYVDHNREYIQWNHYPIPELNSSRRKWGKQGAFGVYSASLKATSLSLQHLHGTIGYPQESKKFIINFQDSKKIWRRFSSKGCTRVDNQTIMFLRNFIPTGTPVFKIYAKEIGPNNTSAKHDYWEYILYLGPDLTTKYPLNLDNKKLIKQELIIEEGIYKFQSKPSAIEIADPAQRNKDYATNPYNIPLKDLSFFDVETGKLEPHYSHPKSIPVGGKELPAFLKKK